MFKVINRYKLFSLTNGLVLFANVILLLAFFGTLASNDLGIFFNSDTLYLPSVYRDVCVDNIGLQYFHFNPAPNFFPDMIVYFVLSFICGGNIMIVFFVFAFLQYFILIFILKRLLFIISPGCNREYFSIIYLSFVVFILEALYLGKDPIFIFLLVINSYHTGSFIMALVCLMITLNYFNSSKKAPLILLFLIGSVSVFSDKLFIVLYSLPMVFTSFILILRNVKQFSAVIAVNTAFVSVALITFNYVSKHYIIFDGNTIDVTQEKMSISFHHFTNIMSWYLGRLNYISVAMYFVIFSFPFLIILLFKILKTQNVILSIYLVYMLFFTVISITAPILSGNFDGGGALRYCVYPMYMIGINYAVLHYYFLRNNTTTRINYIVFGMAVMLVAIGFYRMSFVGLKAYFSYYPETAERLDKIAEKEGLMCGVGDYWYAKSTTMFSKKGVKVFTVYPNLSIHPHVINEKWYWKNENKFNFVLLNNFADTNQYKGSLKTYKRLYNEIDFKLVKTNVFKYVKGNAVPINDSTAD